MSQIELQNAPPDARSLPAQVSAEPISLRGELDDDLQHEVGVIQRELPPADRGVAAWRLLGAAFVFEALLWGISAPSRSSYWAHRD